MNKTITYTVRIKEGYHSFDFEFNTSSAMVEFLNMATQHAKKGVTDIVVLTEIKEDEKEENE